MFCAETCNIDAQCLCGQRCSNGKCRTKCNPGACPAGQLCQRGACVAGCRTNLDCPSDKTCTKGQCLDPCANKGVCGKQALCKISDHRVVCLCPDGYKGDPAKQCNLYECDNDENCDNDKKCVNGACKNMCLQSGACGINAQCRVSNRNAQCSCPPGYFGNPQTECQPQMPGACARNPCGNNARCRDVIGGYECSCAPGCVGDPRKGCICGDHLMNVCANQQCGKNAACRVLNQDEPECYCPPEYPNGDPYTSCKYNFFFFFPCLISKKFLNKNIPFSKGDQFRDNIDCRINGCSFGECVRQGNEFVCRQGKFICFLQYSLTFTIFFQKVSIFLNKK